MIPGYILVEEPWIKDGQDDFIAVTEEHAKEIGVTQFDRLTDEQYYKVLRLQHNRDMNNDGDDE